MKDQAKEYRLDLGRTAGFVGDAGTREPLVPVPLELGGTNVPLVIEECRCHNIPLCMCFVDLAKAIDRQKPLSDVKVKMILVDHASSLYQG